MPAIHVNRLPSALAMPARNAGHARCLRPPSLVLRESVVMVVADCLCDAAGDVASRVYVQTCSLSSK
jgi:hypothetical protein